MNECDPDTDAYVGVGSNIAPEDNVPRALDLLARQVHLLDVSTAYWTPAVGRADQADYLNCVLKIRTDRPARALKEHVLRPIEDALGRIRSEDKYAARPMDLDILIYGREILDEPGLCLPDPDILRRPFLAVCLLELVPDMILPGMDRLLADVPFSGSAVLGRPDFNLTKQLKARIIS